MHQAFIAVTDNMGFAARVYRLRLRSFEMRNVLGIRIKPFAGLRGLLILSVVAFGIAGCAHGPRESGITDPHEARNRQIHEFNKSLDRSLLKPASKAYGKVAVGPISKGVDNFASNLGLPGIVMNDLLQFRLGNAVHNTARFALNSTFGLAGLLDVATQNRLPERTTDFGETLYVWGFPEGNFVELPVFSASTQRATVGLVVDFVANPTNILLSSAQRNIGTAAKILKKADDRNKYSDLVDSVLYESADSYAQSRLLYLQSRRHALYGGLTEDDLEDPYAE